MTARVPTNPPLLHLTVERHKLVRLIRRVRQASGRANPMVRVSGYEHGLEVTAGDPGLYGWALRAVCDARVETPGAVTVAADALAKALGTLSAPGADARLRAVAGQLRVEHIDGTKVHATNTVDVDTNPEREAKDRARSVGAWPEYVGAGTPEVGQLGRRDWCVTVDGGELATVRGAVAAFGAHEYHDRVTQRALEYVSVEAGDLRRQWCATDGYTLAVLDAATLDANAMGRGVTLVSARMLAATGDGGCELARYGEWAVVEQPELTMWCRTVNLEFPDWKSLELGWEHSVCVERAGLVAALAETIREVGSRGGAQSGHHRVTLVVDQRGARLEAAAPSLQRHELAVVVNGGNEVELAFDARRLKAAVMAAGSETVTIGWRDARHAVTVSADGEWRAHVMPLRPEDTTGARAGRVGRKKKGA